MSPEDLKQSANRLDELSRLIVRSYIEWNPELVAQLATEFADTKRRVQTHLIENPSAQLPGAEAAASRVILTKIAAGESLPVEDALIGRIIDCGLDEEDLEEIGARELYSWISHIEYASGLFKAGALIVNCDSLPSNLGTFLDEARQCFAFQQYNAVCALCRAMLDISVKDVATTRGILQRDDHTVVQLARRRHESLRDLINAITHRPEFAHLRDQLHEIRISTNPVVHGGRAADEDSAIRTLRDALKVIHKLYEVTG